VGFFICIYLYDMKFIITEEQSEKLNQKVKSMVNKYGIEYTLMMFDNNVDIIKRTYKDNPLDFLNQFNDLTLVEKYGKINYVNKDGISIFYYYPKKNNEYVFINYHRMWIFFKEVIGFENSEIKSIIKNWLEETYNLKGLTPNRVNFTFDI